jgi:hypothetical protein
VALDQAFFLQRAQQLFPDYFGGLVQGLAAHQAQAKLMEAIGSLQSTMHARAFIDSATGFWLDLHAICAGTTRKDGESDANLRTRIRQLPDAVSIAALQRVLAGLTLPGLTVEIIEAENVAFIDECYVSSPMVYAVRFADGSASVPTAGALWTPPSAGATYQLGIVGVSLKIAQVGGGARACSLTTAKPPPTGTRWRLTALAKEQNSGSLSAAQVQLTANGATTTIVVSADGKLSATHIDVTADGANPLTVAVNVPAGAGQGAEIGELAIYSLDNHPQGDAYGLDGSKNPIIIHAGPGDYLPLHVAGSVATPDASTDAACDWYDDGAAVPNTALYLTILAAMLAAKAAGFPLKLWIDPFYP